MEGGFPTPYPLPKEGVGTSFGRPLAPLLGELSPQVTEGFSAPLVGELSPQVTEGFWEPYPPLRGYFP